MSKLRALLLGAVVALGFSATAEAAPEVQQVTTPGGFKALLVTTPTPHMVDVNITFSCGPLFDPNGKEGLAHLTSTLFNESVAGMDTLTFTRKMEDLGTSIGGEAGGEYLSVKLRSLSTKLDGSFALYGKAVLHPDFTDGDTARMKQQIISGLQDDATDPDTIAGQAYARLVYGDNPRSRPDNGTVDSVSGLTAADVKALHSRCVTRSNAVISVVGDVDAATLSHLLDTYLADMPQGDGRWQAPVITTPVNPSLKRIEVPVPQSTILMGHLLDLPRDHEDFWPLHVANYIFGGGGFESRLTDEVREKRGLAYSVGSNIWSIKQRGMFMVQTGVKNATVDTTIHIVRDELAKLVGDGVTDEELKNAKAYLAGEFPIRMGSNSTIMSYLDLMQLEGLPLDYMDTRVDKILAVTKADILRAVQRHLSPDKLTTVIVGGN
ncbi:MAG: hypothetical protein GC134_08390 [Proteobacteria bacterium]|nr:hypothetical protein [Pseudomonadota bacterium]